MGNVQTVDSISDLLENWDWTVHVLDVLVCSNINEHSEMNSETIF